ncbi:kinase-like domain-containing protein [Syncephalis plumigaleata]|nr:kinase-like domain-containing protein [Syncephalis plumigaleata]
MNKEDGNQKVEVNEDTTKAVDNTEDATSTTTTNANTAANAANTNAATNATTTNTSTSMLQRDHPWEYLDDIMSILKSTNPLLALTMETMIDQILARLKPTSEEDMYRLLVALLNDGIQQLASRLSHNDKDATLSTASLSNIQRIVDILPSGELKTAFARDFVEDRPTLPQYVRRLREWRDSFVAMMAERPTELPLESYSHYLTEFEHQRFDDVEIPGQYSLLKDNNNDFIRIERFEPTVVTTRQQVSYVKNIAIRGHNGTIHPFMIQHPCPRFCRREERLVQLFRLLNSVLERRLETRRRSLQFHLPVAIPLAPQLRLVQLDPSYVTLHDVLETQLNMQDTPVHEPIFKYLELLTELATDDKTALPNIKHEIVESIASTLVPADTLTRYFTRRQQTPADLWMLRKRFTAQWATSTFLTHILGVNARHPHKYHVSLATGNLWTAELFPSQDFAINEAVPFRLTPNLQHFMTPNGLEGIFAVSLLCIADAFIESKTEVEDLLSSTSGSATTGNATSEHQQTSTASNDTTSSNLKNDSGANTTSKPSNTSHKVTSHADDGESISEEVGMLSAAHVSSSSLDRLGQTTSQTSLDENVDTTMDTEQDEAKDGHHLAESAIQPQAMITAARGTTEKLMRKIQILACRAERDMAWRQLASTSTHQTNGLSTSANTNTTTDGGDAMEVDDVLAAPSEVVPLDQSVLDLIAQATNPQKLAQMNCVWMPWF